MIALIIAVLAVLMAGWWNMIRMPGKNFQGLLSPLTLEQMALRDELALHVQKLAGEIGERNESHYAALQSSADYIEQSFSKAGLHSRRDSYEMRGRTFDNIEATIDGAQPELVVIGAHYDSVFGSPGANDNGSGVAALLVLARRFASKSPARTLRFVAFVNEEPPYFQSEQMGSLVYANRCKDRRDPIYAMMSLETIGYYSHSRLSQSYPLPGLGLFYPTIGNFIGIVGNTSSRSLVREAIAQFRQHAQIPCEGAALPVVIPGIGWSDQWSFWQQGYRGIMITDTALFRYPHYHARTDTPEKLDYDSMTRVVEGLENVIHHFASASD